MTKPTDIAGLLEETGRRAHVLRAEVPSDDEHNKTCSWALSFDNCENGCCEAVRAAAKSLREQQDKEWVASEEAGQIDRLATFIMNEVPGEPSRSEGAVNTAIRLLGSLRDAEPVGWRCAECKRPHSGMIVEPPVCKNHMVKTEPLFLHPAAQEPHYICPNPVLHRDEEPPPCPDGSDIRDERARQRREQEADAKLVEEEIEILMAKLGNLLLRLEDAHRGLVKFAPDVRQLLTNRLRGGKG